MNTTVFCQKLAVERCLHNLAQLCAVMFLMQEGNLAQSDMQYRTIKDLIGCLNRDLGLINGSLVDADLPVKP
jgi:hypothetical protein